MKTAITPISSNPTARADWNGSIGGVYARCIMSDLNSTTPNCPDDLIAAQPLEPMMREAGKIALHYFGSVSPERKADQSVVTAADREVERFLVRELTNRFPDHACYGEEYGASENKNARCVWMIDPIDGTAGFVSELPTWTICAGLLVDGVPQTGLVYAPVAGDLYMADPSSGATVNGRPIHVSDATELKPDSTLLAYSYAHHELDLTWPGRIWALSSAAVTVVYAARGSITAGLVDRVHSYDVAAAAAILKQAGGELRNLQSGTPVDFHAFKGHERAEDWMIATNPGLQDEVRKHFKAKNAG